MEDFNPLNFLLTFCGCRFFRKSYCMTWASWLFLVFQASSSFSAAYYYNNDFTVILVYSKDFWLSIVWQLETFFDALFLGILLWNRKQLEQILRLNSKKLSRKSRRSLRGLSIWGFVISLSITLKNIIAHSFQIVSDPAYAEWSIFVKINVIWDQKDCNLILGRFVFCYFARLVTCREKQVLKNIVKEQSWLTPEYVFEERRKLIKLKKFVINKFAILPVIWFLREFVYFVAVIVSRDETLKGDSLFFYLTTGLPFFTSMAIHTFLIRYIDHCRYDLKEQTERLTISLAKKDYKKWKSILRDFDNDRPHEFTVYNLFDINKRTGLSFVSSLITLTVLFEKLLSSLPDQEK